MTITKTFTQIHVSHDCEGRYWDWEDTNKNYEELAEELRTKWDGWFDAVAIVEKTFDDETFTITTKMLKKTARTYGNNYRWNGAEEEEG